MLRSINSIDSDSYSFICSTVRYNQWGLNKKRRGPVTVHLCLCICSLMNLSMS